MSTDWRTLCADIVEAMKAFDDHMYSCTEDAATCKVCEAENLRFETALLMASQAFRNEELDAGVRKSRDRSLF